MRKLLLTFMVMLAGCSGPMRMKPGSDVSLPAKTSLVDAALQGLACSAQKRDSLRKTPAAAGGDARVSGCISRSDTVRRP